MSDRKEIKIPEYDCSAELDRCSSIPDVSFNGYTLNRGTARIGIAGDMNAQHLLDEIDRHSEYILVTTHGEGAPVVQLGYPTAGHYVMCEAGVYFDIMLGCAQKILCEHHPAFSEMGKKLLDSGTLLRREINTDDYLALAPGFKGIHTPQDLAKLVAQAMNDRWPQNGGYRCFLSNSGAESVEAAIKLAQLVKYRKLLEKYGPKTFTKLCGQLNIESNTILEFDKSNHEPVWKDYPFFLFAYEGAFHGRTMGALSLTQSKKAHQIGFSKLNWVMHFTYNGDVDEIRDIIDKRDLGEIVDSPGGVARVLENGMVPKDLAAGVFAEGLQGEGGYTPGKAEYFAELRELCDEFEIMLVADEVQTFARCGTLFAFEHLCRPDAICYSKGGVIGVTITAAENEKYLHGGWHSNTFGGGKVIDTNFAYTTVDTLLNYEDPVLGGLSYLENELVKGEYLRARLGEVRDAHPEFIGEISGYGVMNGIGVREREKVIQTGWKRGLKMLGCGKPGEFARIRLLCLADVLTREIDDFVENFAALIEEVESGNSE